MPRARGEAAKLGDYYEGIWTVDSLLDLLSEEAISLQPEPIDATDAEGIEFVKTLADGKIEYHSAKRQKVGTAWSLKNFAGTNPSGRSILGDLFAKLARHQQARSVFVSQTGANELLELCDRARRSNTLADWDGHLRGSKHLAEDFKDFILPPCGQRPDVALDYLKRLRVVPFEEQELIKRVAQKTAQWIYRPDGAEVDAGNVRRLLAEFVINRLGQTLRKTDVLAELERHGFHLRVWAKDQSLLSAVEALNESYLGPIRRQFINNKPIPRTEASDALKRLAEPGSQKAQLIVGSAGMGKSCVIVEMVERLITARVPVVCLRLDNLPRVLVTDNLGRELGLPRSPAVVVAGIAHGGRCVLVIDQLDALSLVSGRNDHLWPVFHLLLAEAGRVPNMRVLLACRAFDLHHDQRLRALTGEQGLAETVELSLLAVEQVHDAVRAAGGNPTRLGDRQIELLRTPFNLQLFLQGEPTSYSLFRSVKDLFDRFWDCKAALVAAQAWDKCINTLAQALSHGASSAPSDILDQHAEDAKKMASHGVLILENRRWRFFHETFGDYAFARQFAREGRDLVKFLTDEGEQHLYRRAQVRQILTYERDRDRGSYIRTLRRLMVEARVRMHIKKIALEWISQLDDPGEDEWQLVESLLHEAVLGPHAFSVLWERVPWFDLLHRLGAWPKLLTDEHNNLGEQCARMFGMDVMMRERSAIIADLFAPYCRDPKWRQRFHQLFYFGRADHSRKMFDLLVASVEVGVFDELNCRDNLLFHRLSENRPDYAVEFIGRYLDRLCALAQQRGEANPFSDPTTKRSIRDIEIRLVAEKEPLIFAKESAPRLEKLILANALPPENGEVRDNIWRHLTLGAEHDMDDGLLFSTARALRTLAADNPAVVNNLTNHWHKLPHRTIRFLLMSAWVGNAVAFADTAATYLIANPVALDLGYFMVIGEGNPVAAVSRALLQAISPHCSDKSHAKLENVICALDTIKIGEDAKHERLIQLALLRSLLPERLRPESRARIRHLEIEFPGAEFPLPHARGAVFLGRAPSDLDLSKSSDEEWLAVLKECSKQDAVASYGGRQLKALDLIGPLSKQARVERRRFANLTARMDDDIFPIYFSTILEAILPHDDSAKEGGPVEQLDTTILCKVIARLHTLPEHPCGRAISSVVYRIADKNLPVEILQTVGYYAVHDPDPTPDNSEREGKELVNHAINTVRGTAADSLARILFSQPDLAPSVTPILEKLTRDPSPSIRAVTIHPLLALLNRDRDTAVRFFLHICESDPCIWASHHVEEFIFFATFTHYAAIQPLLRRMVGSEDQEAKRVAAHQICMAAFRHKEAESDLSIVLGGDEVCRRAAAEIYGQNHHHPSILTNCENYLLPLLNDSSPGVRRAAEFWLDELKVVTAAGDWNFFRQYLESEAFAEEPGICLHELQEIPAVPPEVVLRLADRAIELSKQDAAAEPAKAYRFATYTPTLVVRLYHQTDDEALKSRCLDLLDAMLALGWNEAAIEMAKAER